MKADSPLAAIRSRCLDCCMGQANEVKLCTADDCPLYHFRFGTNPYRKKKELTEEHKQKLLLGLERHRKSAESEGQRK